MRDQVAGRLLQRRGIAGEEQGDEDERACNPAIDPALQEEERAQYDLLAFEEVQLERQAETAESRRYRETNQKQAQREIANLRVKPGDSLQRV